MQLQLKHPLDRDSTLEAYFTVDPDYPPEVIADGQLMLSFLQYLQAQVAEPDLEVVTQMFGVWFSHPAYPGNIRIAPWNSQLLVSYPIPKTWSGWDSASMIGSTNNIAIATEMLFSAFVHQPTPPDWANNLVDPNGVRHEQSEQEYKLYFCKFALTRPCV